MAGSCQKGMLWVEFDCKLKFELHGVKRLNLMNFTRPAYDRTLRGKSTLIEVNPRSLWFQFIVCMTVLLILLATDQAAFFTEVRVLEFLEDKCNVSWDFPREFGNLYATALALVLMYRFSPRRRKAIPVILSAVLVSGAACYVTQQLISRQRPSDDGNDGQTHFYYPFKKFISKDHFSPSMPSGHATVAMANAYAISTFYPPAGVVLYPMAVMTGLSRINAKDHFASDVFLGFLFGIYVTRFFIAFLRRKFDLEDIFPEKLNPPNP